MKRISGLIMVTLLVTLCFQLQSNYAQQSTNDTVFVGFEATGRPVAQVINADGSTRATRRILNPNVNFNRGQSEVLAGTGEPRILFCGDEVRGTARGPIWEVRNRDLGLVRVRFALNPNFFPFACFAEDTNADTFDEIVVVGIDSVTRRVILQVFDQRTGNLLISRFVMNPTIQSIFLLDSFGDVFIF